MRKVHAYLLPVKEQGIEDMRITHLLKTLDIMENDVRIYVQGQDFKKVEFAPPECPFITIDVTKKSFDNAWQEILGDKEHDTHI